MFTRLYRYGASVNSHDLVKVLAIVLMIIDHIGFYVLGDAGWYRVVGRGAAPLFFFLVGYGSHFRVTPSLVVYGVILTAVNLLFFQDVFLNILINFIFIKLFLRYFKPYEFNSSQLLALVMALIIINPILSVNLEYGSSGLLFAISARLIAEADPRGRPLLLITIFQHFAYQAFAFNFIASNDLLMGLIVVALFTSFILDQFRMRSWDVPLPLLTRIVARYSLGIYFWHLLILKFYLLFRLYQVTHA